VTDQPARWRAFVDWAHRHDWILKFVSPFSTGNGRLRWIDHMIPLAPAPARTNLSDWKNADLAVCWIGHATLLVKIGGLTILTDPVFWSRIGLGFGLFTLGPSRLVDVPIQLQDLPPIDIVLVSHGHFDHLDRPTLFRLAKLQPKARVFASAGLSDLLADLDFDHVTELSRGDVLKTRVNDREITLCAVNVKHWGPRVAFDHFRGYGAFLLEVGGRKFFYGADSAYCDHWKDLGPVDIAAVGIGAYDPWIEGHANPEQAWEMASHTQPTYVVPMHHSTFRLSNEPVAEPLKRFLAAMGDQRSRAVVTSIGQVWYGQQP
jgi:L-ascorbate metabolism protein UlaG (beta-lactamase superfamily)